MEKTDIIIHKGEEAMSFLPSATEGRVWRILTKAGKKHVVSIAQEGIMKEGNTFKHEMFKDREIQLRSVKYFRADRQALANFHQNAIQIMRNKHNVNLHVS